MYIVQRQIAGKGPCKCKHLLYPINLFLIYLLFFNNIEDEWLVKRVGELQRQNVWCITAVCCQVLCNGTVCGKTPIWFLNKNCFSANSRPVNTHRLLKCCPTLLWQSVNKIQKNGLGDALTGTLHMSWALYTSYELLEASGFFRSALHTFSWQKYFMFHEKLLIFLYLCIPPLSS